jgi:hypothetical protein
MQHKNLVLELFKLKKMKNLVKTSALLLLVTVIFSCAKKNDVTPKFKKLSYQFKVVNASVPISATTHSSSSLTINSTTGPNIVWQSGYVNVASISFEGKNENNNDTKNDFKEPIVYKLDLFNNSQLLGNIDIASGIYHNADIKLELQQSPNGSALFLKGTYTTSTGSKPVELALNEGNDQFEIIANAKDLNVTTKAAYIAFINLHLEKLMAGVTAASLNAATTTNGTISINKTSNTAIYSKIKSNINSFSDVDYDN